MEPFSILEATVEGWKNISPSLKFWNMNDEKLGATLSMQATP